MVFKAFEEPMTVLIILVLAVVLVGVCLKLFSLRWTN